MSEKKKCIECKRAILLYGPNRKNHALKEGEICKYADKKGGRPTKYNDEMLKKTRNYINGSSTKINSVVVRESYLSTGYEHVTEVNLPTVQGLSLVLGVNVDTIHSWRQNKNMKEFAFALEQLKYEQYDMLVNYGLSGLYNTSFCLFMLRVNHGMGAKKFGPRENRQFESLLD